MRNFEKLRHKFFSRAISKNVIREPKWRSNLNLAIVNVAVRTPLVKPTVPDKPLFEKPESNPVTQRYWENTRGIVSYPAGTTDPWLVELARVTVPQSEFAVVKGFEQWVRHVGIEVTTVFSESDSWGDPFVMLPNVPIVWHFRLEKTLGAEPPWYAAVNPSQIPGEPHFDQPSVSDLWFPAGSPPSQNFHLFIGGKYRLRVFALVDPVDEYAIDIAAKIRGYRMSAFDRDSMLAARAIW